MVDPWILKKTSKIDEIERILQKYGFAIIPNALDRVTHDKLHSELSRHFDESNFCDGLFYGQRTKRFGRVLARSVQSQRLAVDDLALGAARRIVGKTCQEVQLNLTQAIEIWPNSPAQVPHRDQDIWMGATHSGEFMLNAMWAIDDFTTKNGGTLIWPESHKRPEMTGDEYAPITANMKRGSLCLFLGSTLHCGGANWSGQNRRGLVISYCQGWLKPCENPWLSYPPHIAAQFTTDLQSLVGYRMDTPSLNNVDGRCPSELLCETRPPRGFVDRLTIEQVNMIEQYNAAQFDNMKKAA